MKPISILRSLRNLPAPVRFLYAGCLALTALVLAAWGDADTQGDATAVAHLGASAVPLHPVPAVQRVVIISIDGLRPDVLLLADTPNLHALAHEGSYTFWARTTEMSVTLPSHTSMLTGVTPARHGVTWNADLLGPQKYPKVPTLFELAKKAGLTTAIVTGKTKFTALNKPGTVDWPLIAAVPDAEVARRAVRVIHEYRPQVLFIHFPGDDAAGHGIGWGSPQQLAAVAAVDREVGIVLAALDEENLSNSTVVIVSADHGGAGRTHGPGDVRSRTIPWIARGPGIRQGFDLTLDPGLTVNTEDTFATACVMLGLRPPSGIDGKFVAEILQERGELMHDQP